MPKDAQVIYRCCSEFEVLDADEIDLVRKEDEKIALHQDRYMEVQKGWIPKGAKTEWATVVTLPGD